MPADFSHWVETLDRLIKPLGIVALAYIIAMGLTHREGVNYGTDFAQEQRKRVGKPVIKGLLLSESPVAFWKDEALIRGGAWAALMILISFSSTALIAFIYPTTSITRPEIISIVFYSTIFGMMNTQILFSPFSPLRGFWEPRLLAVAVGAVIFTVAAFSINVWLSNRGRPVKDVIVYMGLIFVFNSLLYAYHRGIVVGIQDADYEKKLPIVEVQTAGGETISGLRMKSISEAEYRFIREDGSECLMPSAQVRMIRVVVPAATTDATDQVKPGRVAGQGGG